jgi:hypothetical protein
MVAICNKFRDRNINSSIEDLLEKANSWVEGFSKRIIGSGLRLNEKDVSDIYLAAETIVYHYKDMPRAFENAYAFEHTFRINDLLLDAYNNKYRGKADGVVETFAAVPPHNFTECYGKEYLNMIHSVLFHDFVDLELGGDRGQSREFVRNFYNSSRMDRKDVPRYVEMVTLPKGADYDLIAARLHKIENEPVASALKFGDIMDNSVTKGSERQSIKMTGPYDMFIKVNYPAFYQFFLNNTHNNYAVKVPAVPKINMPVRLGHRPLSIGSRKPLLLGCNSLS